MNKIKVAGLLITFCTPIITIAQGVQNITGTWLLKEKKSLQGPNYNNGVPKAYNIINEDSLVILEAIVSYNDKDTIEKDSLKSKVDNPREFALPNSTSRTVSFLRNSSGDWQRLTKIDPKDPLIKQPISIVEVFVVSPDGNELLLEKVYDGIDASGGNQDFSMQASYERSSAKSLLELSATGQGVQFEDNSSWTSILDMAKRNHKYIFVDCYATWCGPCKKMDKEVYDLNIVGTALNPKFIAIKVQLDSAQNDDDITKSKYRLARKFEKEYNISALPTYLFFDYNGNVLHKDIGFHNASEFLDILDAAQNQSMQIYSLANKSKDKKLSADSVMALASKLERIDRKLANEVAETYFNYYIDGVDKQLYSRENVYFFFRHIRSVKSSHLLFREYFKHPERIDSISGNRKGFTKSNLYWIVEEEEIIPYLDSCDKANKAPSWDAIARNVSKKFGTSCATRTVTNMQLFWYKKKESWVNFSNSLEKHIALLGNINDLDWHELNTFAWDMFEHSSNRRQLEKALVWSQTAIKKVLMDTSFAKLDHSKGTYAQFADTYANILYKLGRSQEAINYYQDKVLPLSSDQLYVSTISKMKQGLPTWETR